MTLWRIVKKKFVSTAFDGEGARQFPGRWNNRGVPMVYTSSTPSLAMLEILVQLEADEILTEYYYRIGAEIPDKNLCEIARDLPEDWNLHPSPASTRILGDSWVKSGASLVLIVPSVISPVENNYLINPKHPSFAKIKIGKPEAFTFDDRFLKKT